MSVDDMIEAVFDGAQELGEETQTLAFFISDNGLHWGEHGLRDKRKPYTESIRVPMLMRWPGAVRAGATDERLVANIDIAPTILEAAEIEPDASTPLDGRSLLDHSWKRKRILTEYWRAPDGGKNATWASIRTSTSQYVQYYGISTDRLYATAFMIWLAIVFVWLALTVLRSRPRTFATGLVVSGFVVLFTLNLLNPDALVARANLARGEAGPSGAAGADLRYVASLGGNAVPVLVSALTAPDIAVDTAAAGDRCAAADILLRRWTGERRARMARTWTSGTSRSRATAAIRAHEAELQQLACPETRDDAVTEPVPP